MLLLLICLHMACAESVEAQEREDISWRVGFEGNENYSTMVLRDIIATSQPSFVRRLFRRIDNFILREIEVRRDVIRIQRYYQRRGYDQVEVDYRIEEGKREWMHHVTFEINEGTPLRIREVEVDILGSDESQEIIRSSREYERAISRHPYQPGNRYQLVQQSDTEALFRESMEESGYAYAEVYIVADIDTLAREADLRIVNTPGPRKTFTSFEVIGDLSVDLDLVIRETGIEPGDTYSRRRMQTAQRELFNHHLFRFATVSIPDVPTDSTLMLTMRVREYPQRSIQATIGFGREELVRGQLNWQHRNVGRMGHRFSTMARASFIQQRIGFEYLVPYLFNTRSSFISSPYGQHLVEPAFELFRVGFSNSLVYQHSPNLTGSLSYELTYTSELSGSAETALPDTVLNYNTGSVTISGYYNSSIARARDMEGWLIQPVIEFSSIFGEGTFQYQRGSLDVRRYTRLTQSLMIANRVMGGIILSGENDLPSNTRFFTGGTNSVRGWSRQDLGPKTAARDADGNFLRYVPVGGDVLFNFNIELRQDLPFIMRGIGMSLFLDGGQVWRDGGDLGARPIQFGTGGGIRYDSPIGPVRVDIGYKLNPLDEDINRFEGEDYGSAWDRIGIHFSIGQAF